MLALKGAAVLGFYQVLADVTEHISLYINLFTVLLIVLAAIPVARSRRKDATIHDLEEALRAKTSLVEERVLQLRQLEQGTQHLKTEAAEWKARYEEQAHYTAESAVGHFEQLMEEHRDQVAERHEQLLKQARQTSEVLQGVVASLERLEAR